MTKTVFLLFLTGMFNAFLPAQAQIQPHSVNDSTARYVNRGYGGAGLGLPYGVVGMNVELSLNHKTQNNLYLTGGVGTTLRYGLAYNVGMNLYLTKPETTWRPRVSMLYGVNGVYKDFDEENTYSGLTAGLGQLIQFGKYKKTALSLDAMLVLSSGLFEKLDELDAQHQEYELLGFKRLKFSVGIKGAF